MSPPPEHRARALSMAGNPALADTALEALFPGYSDGSPSAFGAVVGLCDVPRPRRPSSSDLSARVVSWCAAEPSIGQHLVWVFTSEPSTGFVRGSRVEAFEE